MFQYFFFFPATKFLFYIIYESCTCPYTCKRLHRTHTRNRTTHIASSKNYRKWKRMNFTKPTLKHSGKLPPPQIQVLWRQEAHRRKTYTTHTQPNVGCFSLAATENFSVDEHWAPVATTAVQNFCLLLSWRVNKAWPSQFRSQSHFFQERNKKTNLTERDID